jgi:hypothetical protein
MDVGEGVLWRSKVEPTSFKIFLADPFTGQVAFQGRLMIRGHSAGLRRELLFRRR